LESTGVAKIVRKLIVPEERLGRSGSRAVQRLEGPGMTLHKIIHTAQSVRGGITLSPMISHPFHFLPQFSRRKHNLPVLLLETKAKYRYRKCWSKLKSRRWKKNQPQPLPFLGWGRCQLRWCYLSSKVSCSQEAAEKRSHG